MALQEEFENQGNFLFRHRSNLPFLLILAGLVVFVVELMQKSSGFGLSYFWVECISLFISILGLLIRVYTVGHTPANTSGRNTKEGQLADELNQTGIYSTVRHPLYLGNFLMWTGAALLINNLWFLLVFCLVYWIYYERIMYAEEQFLRKKFGTKYTDWASQTPAFLPSLKHFVRPAYAFSWKKVLKKEKNGLLAIFTLIWIFDTIQASFNDGEFIVVSNAFYWAFIFSFVLYWILKLLKKKSSVLDEDGR